MNTINVSVPTYVDGRNPLCYFFHYYNDLYRISSLTIYMGVCRSATQVIQSSLERFPLLFSTKYSCQKYRTRKYTAQNYFAYIWVQSKALFVCHCRHHNIIYLSAFELWTIKWSSAIRRFKNSVRSTQYCSTQTWGRGVSRPTPPPSGPGRFGAAVSALQPFWCHNFSSTFL